MNISYAGSQNVKIRYSKTTALFASSHHPHANPERKCYVVDRFIETIAGWSEDCALLDAVGGLRIVRKSTENLC